VLTRSNHLDYPALAEVRPASHERVRHARLALAGLVLFVVALEVLRLELRAVSWSALMTAVVGVPRGQLALAVALTVLNYAVLTGYDQLAFAYIGKELPRARIALTSFLAYSIANNVGLAMLSGASVRYRVYTRWGSPARNCHASSSRTP
jgi:phosphatidylglycerol lysyltransferase